MAASQLGGRQPWKWGYVGLIQCGVVACANEKHIQFWTCKHMLASGNMPDKLPLSGPVPARLWQEPWRPSAEWDLPLATGGATLTSLNCSLSTSTKDKCFSRSPCRRIVILWYYTLLGRKEKRKGRMEERKKLHTIQFLLKGYSYHNCDVVWILHSLSEEGDPEPRGSK